MHTKSHSSLQNIPVGLGIRRHLALGPVHKLLALRGRRPVPIPKKLRGLLANLAAIPVRQPAKTKLPGNVANVDRLLLSAAARNGARAERDILQVIFGLHHKARVLLPVGVKPVHSVHKRQNSLLLRRHDLSVLPAPLALHVLIRVNPQRRPGHPRDGRGRRGVGLHFRDESVVPSEVALDDAGELRAGLFGDSPGEDHNQFQCILESKELCGMSTVVRWSFGHLVRLKNVISKTPQYLPCIIPIFPSDHHDQIHSIKVTVVSDSDRRVPPLHNLSK